MLVDGTNSVLGRMATQIAKTLLKGEEVSIVNADKVIITGSPDRIVGEYLKKKTIGSPQHGPFFPRKPELIVRRTIRGMLPYKTRKGREAFKKLRVYVNIPEELAGEAGKAKPLAAKEIKTDYITIGKLARSLGWSG